jgi:hypothetical protein
LRQRKLSRNRELGLIPAILSDRTVWQPFWQIHAAVLADIDVGRDDDFPGMTVRISEIARVTTIAGLVRRLQERGNKLSCSPPRLGRTKWSVVNFERRLFRPSFSHAISNRRPIIHAIGPVPFILVPHCES